MQYCILFKSLVIVESVSIYIGSWKLFSIHIPLYICIKLAHL